MDIFPFFIQPSKLLKLKLQLVYKHIKNIFGKNPRGIWLPECGYVPETDKYLREIWNTIYHNRITWYFIC